MADKDHKAGSKSGPKATAEPGDQLRANLKKRKAQSQARAQADEDIQTNARDKNANRERTEGN